MDGGGCAGVPTIDGVSSDAVVTGPPGSAAVAAGSAGAVDAAVHVLRAGGSAVDAVLAAAFASVMTEPVLSSLGGGGFLLHAPADGEPELLDFFVTVPGLDGTATEPRVETVVVDFAKAGPAASTSEQVFHGGWGSVAVPGALAGHLDAHRRWGRLPLGEVVAPAAALAREGVVLSPVQRRFLVLVSELLRLTPESRELFSRTEIDGTYRNPAYAALLDALAAGTVSAQDDPAYAVPLVHAAQERGGLLTAADLAAYTPELRAPATVARGDARVWTNPAPSAGGPIVLDALSRITAGGRTEWASVAAAQADARAAHRRPGTVPTGTTHATVVDADGAFAALTTSNGSQSGAVVPGWGVTLNNMLGEEDLQPGEPLPPGARMGSMMAPTLVAWPEGRRVALGTGGSERIRSAVLCVLARMIDEGDHVAAAVAAPRVHVSGDEVVHLEPGLEDDELAAIARLVESRRWPAYDAWPTTNIYFGGVHAVERDADGSVTAVGDARRGGAAAVVRPDGEVVRAWSEA